MRVFGIWSVLLVVVMVGRRLVMKFESIRGSRSRGPRFFSVAEVARMFEVSPMTLYRAIGAGEFPAVKIRGRYIVPAQVVDAMAEAAMRDGTVVDAATWTADSPAG
jgi:excisionase family DNA binding protein